MESNPDNASRLVQSEISFIPVLLDDYNIQTIFLMNRIALCSIVGTFGIASNVINICVFVRQGLNSSINVSFFAMAVSDTVRIVTVHWMNFCSSPHIRDMDVPFDFEGVAYLTGGWPVGCANRITMFITAYVTAERCICIVVPLRVKKMITPFRTCVVLVAVDVLNALALAPEYVFAYFDWRFSPAKNKTLLALAFRGDMAEFQGVAFTLHAALITLALVAVVALTSVLVIQLRRRSKWRQENVGAVETSYAINNRDRRTVKMVILIATVMVICYFPAVVLSLVTAVLPDFGVVGRLATLFHCLWSIVFILGTAQASVNIFIYYAMSTKYKDCFKELCGKGSRH